ncbi:MAG TPA: NUDIX domain-containing protein [Alphaproteobacteria bacterium]|nr:NUDIX domain-containing protein [Alphaproteobacteria bacterium]
MERAWQSLARIWRLGGGGWRWRLLWLRNATFLVGVTGVVTNEAGEILLLRHRFWRAGTWGLPSGLAERHETMEEAFAREVREETGLEIDAPSLVRVVSGFRLRLEVHFAAPVMGGEMVLDRREILEAKFFAPNELPDGLLHAHRETVALVLSG